MRLTRLNVFLMTTLVAIGAFASIPEPAKAAKFCNEIFMPVCAVKHGVRKTYSNACFAHLARARVLHAGECINPAGNICFMIFIPVCAINPVTHHRQTYPNLCHAEVANATVVSEGACP
jgi:large-conductance mechanosensitive channel